MTQGAKPPSDDVTRDARHAGLVREMIGVTGSPLGARAVDGRISRAALGTLVDRCKQCPHPGSCAAWLADHEGGADAPPLYCLNRDRLAAGD